MKLFLYYIAIFSSLAALSGCSASAKKDNAASSSNEDPLNIIFLIGDGMGIPQISTAYFFNDEQANFSRFQHIGLQRTTDTFRKVTDSAAGATAFSIGEKTYTRAIGVDSDSVAQETILERLQKEGYQTGLISLTTITHATPAAFYAHVKDRDQHEDIAAQLTEAGIDFFAGGGRNYFSKRSDGQNLFATLQKKGYHLDTSALSEPKLEARNAFLLADESLPSKVEGREDYLPQATRYALDYFSRKQTPFFLMVEGSYIDWAGHAENADMLIQEVEDFDLTLGVALDFIEQHPNTLLIVTADHETGEVSLGKKYTPTNASGQRTSIPQEVSVNFHSDQHSAELIPVFAKGPGAEHFQGIYDNHDIYHKLVTALGLEKQ